MVEQTDKPKDGQGITPEAKRKITDLGRHLEAVTERLATMANTLVLLCKQVEATKRELDGIFQGNKERLERAGWTYFKDGMWVEPNHAFVLLEQQAIWFMDRAATDSTLSIHEIYTFIALGWEPIQEGGWRHPQLGTVTDPDVMRKHLNNPKP